MTLTTSIAATTKTLFIDVRIGGVPLTALTDPTGSTGNPGVIGLRITNRIGQAPVCALDLSRTPTWITRGMEVIVKLGYDGLSRQRFTGTVQDRSKSIGRGTVNCVGNSSPLYTTSIIPDRDTTGQTTAAALANILSYVGIIKYNITTTRADVAEFTMGTVTSTILRNMSAAQMVNYIMELQGCKIFETGDGTTVINVIDEIPAPTAIKTYTTNDNTTARILTSELREDPTFVRTRVKVTGATPTSGASLTATATVGGLSPLVKPPLPSGSYIDSGIFNSLADTQAKVNAMSLFYLTQWHRIPKYLDLDIPGDPELECAATIGLVIPEQDISGNFFITGWEDSITPEGGYRTTFSGLRGGDDLGGTLTISPIAAFTMQVEREVFGTGTTDFVVVTLDASGSFDPDGSLTGVYTWTSNKTTTPTMASSTAKTRTVRIDSASLDGTGTDWTITLSVTDNSGATTAITLTVPYPTTRQEVTIPAIGLAYNSGFGQSPDGGQTWHDITGATCTSTAMRPADGIHFGHQLAGFTNGVIKRTTDGGATSSTVYTYASAASVVYIVYDWRNSLVAWAMSANMELAISLDAGATWTIYDSLRGVLPSSGTSGVQVVSGTYVKSGVGTTQAITGVGFQPDMVIVKSSDASKRAYFRSSNMTALESYPFIGSVKRTDAIISLDADGFSVGVDLGANQAGTTTYHYIAFKDLGGLGTNIKFGTYTGNNPGTQSITGVGFQPALVWVKGDNATIPYWRSSTMTTTRSADFAGSTAITNGVTSLDSNGFSVGANLNVNTSPDTYYYVAFRSGASGVTAGSFTGNGTSQSITGLGFSPAWLLMRDDPGANDQAAHRGATGWPTTTSSQFSQTASDYTDAITALGADGFSVGAIQSVNKSATQINYVAFRGTAGSSGSPLFPAAIPGRRCIGLPAGGSVYVFGGDGVGNPLIAFDANIGSHVWTRVSLTGDIATDFPADATCKINDYQAPGTGSAVMILSFASGGGALIQPIYRTATAGVTVPFTRASGLTAGLKNGVYVVGDAPSRGDGFFYAAFGDRDIWASTDGGTTWAKTALVMPVGVTPNDAIWAAGVLTGYPDFTGLYLIAAEADGTSAGGLNSAGLYKSADGMQTVTVLRPAGGTWPTWPASGKGKMVSIGAPNATSAQADFGRLLIAGRKTADATVREIGNRLATNWNKKEIATDLSGVTNFRARVITSSNWFVGGPGSTTTSGINSHKWVYTKNSGTTWTALALPSGVDSWTDFAINADGTLIYGITRTGTAGGVGDARIYSSSDSGDNWTLVKTFTDSAGAVNINLLYRIACHPTNTNQIMIVGQTGTTSSRFLTQFSSDAGANFTRTTFASDTLSTSGPWMLEAFYLTNGRVVFNMPRGSESHLYTTDDGGATITDRQTIGSYAAGDELLGLCGEVGGTALYAIDANATANTNTAYYSTNQGVTWTAFTNTVGGTSAATGGITYDSVSKALFVLIDTNSATNANYVWRMNPVIPAGTWVDITGDLVPFVTTTIFDIQNKGNSISVIP